MFVAAGFIPVLTRVLSFSYDHWLAIFFFFAGIQEQTSTVGLVFFF